MEFGWFILVKKSGYWQLYLSLVGWQYLLHFFKSFQNYVDMPYSVHHDITDALRYTLFFLIMFLCGDFIPEGMSQRAYLLSFFFFFLNLWYSWWNALQEEPNLESLFSLEWRSVGICWKRLRNLRRKSLKKHSVQGFWDKFEEGWA